MKIVTFILFVSFLAFTHLVSAKAVFKVIGSKGSVMLGNQKLKVGMLLSPEETIEIGDDAYLCLATLDTHKVIELTSKNKGKHTVKEILAKVPAKQDLEEKYVAFVVNELTKQDNSGITAKNRFQHMNKTGAVKRGGVARSSLEDKKANANDNIKVYGDKLFIQWHLSQDPKDAPLIPFVDSYKVEILSTEDEVYFEQIVQGAGNMEIVISLSQVRNNGEKNLMYRITALDKKGKQIDKTKIDAFNIVLLSENEKKVYAKDLAHYSSHTILSLLEKAKYFESKELIVDAMVAYKEAEELMKDN